ncbi:MAG: hypothetical protein ABIJ96_01960 [Elusimicrobiota bacterium]
MTSRRSLALLLAAVLAGLPAAAAASNFAAAAAKGTTAAGPAAAGAVPGITGGTSAVLDGAVPSLGSITSSLPALKKPPVLPAADQRTARTAHFLLRAPETAAENIPKSSPQTAAAAAEQAAEVRPEADAGDTENHSAFSGLFDNAWIGSKDANDRMGRDPVRLPGDLLSDRRKLDWVSVIRPTHRPDIVVKRFSSSLGSGNAKRAAQNELISRLFMTEERFRPFFEPFLGIAPAFAYNPSRLPLLRPSSRAVVVMRSVPGTPLGRVPHEDSAKAIPIKTMQALFLAAQALGLSDMNWLGVLVDQTGRYRIIDTEQARRRAVPNPSLIGAFDMPWVSGEFLNRPEMFDAVAAFREVFERPDTDDVLRRLLAKAGLGKSDAQQYIGLIRENVKDMTAVLKNDMTVSNRSFLERAAQGGLQEAGAELLSGINESLHTAHDPGRRLIAMTQRELIRMLNRSLGGPVSRSFLLEPAELAFLLTRQTVGASLQDAFVPGTIRDRRTAQAIEDLAAGIARAL